MYPTRAWVLYEDTSSNRSVLSIEIRGIERNLPIPNYLSTLTFRGSFDDPLKVHRKNNDML